MPVISLIRSRDLSFANFCPLSPLKVAKERFPFFRLEVESVCLDVISFFSKGAKIVKGWRQEKFIFSFVFKLSGFSPKAVAMA